MKRDYWNQCDNCGRFIAIDDFDNGAQRSMVTPDTVFTAETYETLCKQCVLKCQPEELNFLQRAIDNEDKSVV